jgi:hypothetical protein
MKLENYYEIEEIMEKTNLKYNTLRKILKNQKVRTAKNLGQNANRVYFDSQDVDRVIADINERKKINGKV